MLSSTGNYKKTNTKGTVFIWFIQSIIRGGKVTALYRWLFFSILKGTVCYPYPLWLGQEAINMKCTKTDILYTFRKIS